MSLGLTQIGAHLQGMAYVMAEQARLSSQQQTARSAADRMRADQTRAVEPVRRLVETPTQIRAQVMAERGVDRLDLMRLGPQARIEAEISISAEAAQRAARARQSHTGAFIDLRV